MYYTVLSGKMVTFKISFQLKWKELQKIHLQDWEQLCIWKLRPGRTIYSVQVYETWKEVAGPGGALLEASVTLDSPDNYCRLGLLVLVACAF